MVDKVTEKIINSAIYGKKIHSTNKEILQSAEKNRLLLYVAQKNNLTEIIEEGDRWISRLNKTLAFIKKTLGNRYIYLVTRTYKYVPYVTFDVDLWVKGSEFKRVVKVFSKSGCNVLSHDFSLGGRISGMQVNIKREDLLTIDLHQNFTWQKRKFLDIDLLPSGVRIKDIAGVKIKIPSTEVEFILCMADIIHERFNITLLDLIWINGLVKEGLNWDLIFNQVKKHGWWHSFKKCARIINLISLYIYKKEIIPQVGRENTGFGLPMFLPLNLCYLSYWENVLKTQKLPLTSFLYMHYCKIRYYLSGKEKMPYYDSWYKK